MSGGSWEYVYRQFADVADRLSGSKESHRRALAPQVAKLSKAMRAIEWNDSGDGDDAEVELCRACLAPGAELEVIIDEAKDIVNKLQLELARATITSRQKKG